MPLPAEFAAALREISVAPFRLLLETPGVEATVPMLRGVWGRALHTLDRAVYEDVFGDDAAGDGRPRGYVLRPAPPDPQLAPAVEWLVFGPAIDHLPTLARAWDMACGMGLGQNRQPFVIRRALPLLPDGSCGADVALHAGRAAAWPLDRAAWPAAPAEPGLLMIRTGGPSGCGSGIRENSDASCGSGIHENSDRVHRQNSHEFRYAACPCRLVFRAPLRLRRQGRLIERPTLADLVVAACRRIRDYLPAERRAAWDETARRALDASRSVSAAAWRGDRLDLHRYSASQQAEVDLFGVCGMLDLPHGAGELWPVLAAARWLHLGKATVMGLGQLDVEPI